MFRIVLIVLLFGVVQPLCAQDAHNVTSKGGVVVCVSPPAAQVGLTILKQGGNAVDAAVAVAFAQAVTWPEAGNIGGGGFLMLWKDAKTKPVMIDYRETAPAAATADMFAKGVNYHHARTAGVPGTVRGMELAHQQYGKLKWAEVVGPAVKLAEGFKIDAALAMRLNIVVKDKKAGNQEFTSIFGHSQTWKAGDDLLQPDLAKTLKAIAVDGAKAFYEGDIAKKIVAEIKASDGLISLDDLKSYRAKLREPILVRYRGYDLLLPPLPSSGGITIALMLNMLEPYDLRKNPWSSVETTHLVAESMKRAFCERARYLGDPDFVTVPKHLLTNEHAKKLMESFDPAKATPSATLAPELDIKDGGESTTHFSIVDKDGMCVSNTYTLENAFGCRVVVRGAGFILNNEMTDFNHKPGTTTKTGLIGTDANIIAPGKRMLSSMTPVIVLKDGQPVLVTGSPGGRTIINTVASVLLNTMDYDATVRQAVDAPRLHMQWFPDRIQLEDRPGLDDLMKGLRAKGHTVMKIGQGDAHSIWIEPKTRLRVGAADKRLSGSAVGED
jgi:gamma-glutamyltranspeptidase/glutathione hydrolase